MDFPHADDAGAWAGRAADVPAEWFARESWLHGVRHTQRVHIHAQRLVRELDWPDDDAQRRPLGGPVARHRPRRRRLGPAARRVERRARRGPRPARRRCVRPTHGIALFAIRYHCRSDGRGERRAIDEDDPERALRILWLLKDADALDRVRLGPPARRLRDRLDHAAPHVHHRHDRVRGGAARRHAVELPPRSRPKWGYGSSPPSARSAAHSPIRGANFAP